MKKYDKINWDNYRFTDGSLGILNILGDRYDEVIDEDIISYVQSATSICPIRSRQVAAVLIGLCDQIQEQV